MRGKTNKANLSLESPDVLALGCPDLNPLLLVEEEVFHEGDGLHAGDGAARHSIAFGYTNKQTKKQTTHQRSQGEDQKTKEKKEKRNGSSSSWRQRRRSKMRVGDNRDSKEVQYNKSAARVLQEFCKSTARVQQEYSRSTSRVLRSTARELQYSRGVKKYDMIQTRLHTQHPQSPSERAQKKESATTKPKGQRGRGQRGGQGTGGAGGQGG